MMIKISRESCKVAPGFSEIHGLLLKLGIGKPIPKTWISLTWVQIWGLPVHCRTKKMGLNIGSCLGTVTESEIFGLPKKKVFVGSWATPEGRG